MTFPELRRLAVVGVAIAAVSSAAAPAAYAANPPSAAAQSVVGAGADRAATADADPKLEKMSAHIPEVELDADGRLWWWVPEEFRKNDGHSYWMKRERGWGGSTTYQPIALNVRADGWAYMDGADRWNASDDSVFFEAWSADGTKLLAKSRSHRYCAGC